jgi:arginine decarboxylase
MRKWKIEDSVDLYNIRGWGENYFGVNDKGNVIVKTGPNDAEVDLKELVEDLQLRDVSMPVLLRFPNILKHRIESINKCFEKASEEYDFKGQYYYVYPIKVNQAKPVVEEIMKHCDEFNIGLEAGSKPELHAVLATSKSNDALIICNGYKDEKFIELALLAQKMGKRIFLVVEKLNELKHILEIAKRHKVKANIGIRIKLASSGSGKWEESGGDQSKFGLNASELLLAIDILKKNDALDCFRFIHFHLGSQITKIRKIKNALREVAQFYVELQKAGCEIDFVDIGGGLGVDYDGSRSFNQSSVNYSIQEYANDAVFMIQDACEKNDLKHPSIVTESGRALTAHHSVLLFNVLETTSLPSWNEKEEIVGEAHELAIELLEILQSLRPASLFESWHDALQIREEALDLFSLGMLDLKNRARIERLFWSIAREVYKLSEDLRHLPEEFRNLPKFLADKYFCNFSLFQSLPDAWAIDQIFPIVPIHRLGEKPNHIATLQDITCDSDGKIDHFIGLGDYSRFLNLHEFKKNEPYYLGVFLIGAYQEILGDMHNLFGDTNVVHIEVDEHDYRIKQIIDGETVSEVLHFVQYDSKKLVRTMESWVTRSVKEGKITAAEGKEFLSNYRSGLYGYTYLE